MKKTSILSISVLAVLLVLSLLLVSSVSAGIFVGAKPNPGYVNQSITITITAGGESATEWRPCELFVDFGDGTSQNIGKLVQEVPQFSTKSITHKYSKSEQYTIKVAPKNCKILNSNTLKTTVQILPPKPGKLPKPRGR